MSDVTGSSRPNIHRLGMYPEAVVPEVGRWLWGMQEARRGLLGTLDRIEQAGFGQEFLDWRGPDGNDNSVGTLLYHVAGVEMGWLYFDLLMIGFPDEVQEWFPFDDRAETGRLRDISGVPLEDHKTRLARARERFLEVVSGLSREECIDPAHGPEMAGGTGVRRLAVKKSVRFRASFLVLCVEI